MKSILGMMAKEMVTGTTLGKKVGKSEVPPLKRAFTLIEVLICLTLMSLIGGVIAFKSRSMINRYRFDKGAEKVLRELNSAKCFALGSGNDYSLTLHIRKEKLYGTLAYSVGKKKVNKPISFGSMSSISLDDKALNPLEVCITGDGWIKKGGVLTLSYRDRYRCLIDLDATPFFVKVAPSSLH